MNTPFGYNPTQSLMQLSNAYPAYGAVEPEDDDEEFTDAELAKAEQQRKLEAQNDPYMQQGMEMGMQGMQGMQAPQLQQRDQMADLFGMIKLAAEKAQNPYQSRTGLGQNMFGLLG